MDRIIVLSVITSVVLVMIGCSKNDNERLAAMSQEYAERQDRQSQKVLELQRELQASQVEVGRQRDALEEERRELAERRYMAPILAAAIQNVGLLIVCTLPLALCWYLLHRHVEPVDDAAVAEVLLEDLATERPLLLTENQNENVKPLVSGGACPHVSHETRDGNLS